MAKEILKENVVEAQTLFIGVGGTGCRIIKRCMTFAARARWRTSTSSSWIRM